MKKLMLNTNYTQLWTLKATINSNLGRHTHWIDSGTNMGVTDHFLIEFKSHLTIQKTIPDTIARLKICD